MPTCRGTNPGLTTHHRWATRGSRPPLEKTRFWSFGLHGVRDEWRQPFDGYSNETGSPTGSKFQYHASNENMSKTYMKKGELHFESSGCFPHSRPRVQNGASLIGLSVHNLPSRKPLINKINPGDEQPQQARAGRRHDMQQKARTARKGKPGTNGSRRSVNKGYKKTAGIW